MTRLRKELGLDFVCFPRWSLIIFIQNKKQLTLKKFAKLNMNLAQPYNGLNTLSNFGQIPNYFFEKVKCIHTNPVVTSQRDEFDRCPAIFEFLRVVSCFQGCFIFAKDTERKPNKGQRVPSADTSPSCFPCIFFSMISFLPLFFQ